MIEVMSRVGPALCLLGLSIEKGVRIVLIVAIVALVGNSWCYWRKCHKDRDRRVSRSGSPKPPASG